MAQEAKRNIIDDYFRERLFEYSPPAPADSWSKIDEESKKRKKIKLWISFGAMAASMAIVISLGIGYYFGTKQTLKQYAQKETVNKQNTSDLKLQTKTYDDNVKDTYNNNVSSELKTEELSNEYIANIVIKSRSNESMPMNISNKVILSDKLNPIYIDKLEYRKSTRLKISKESAANILEISNIQEELPEELPATKKIWALGGGVSPQYSKWDVKNNNFYTNEYVSSVETPVLAYSGGLNVSVSSNRWKFESGVNYMQSKQNLDEVSENLYVAKTNSRTEDKLGVNEIVKNPSAVYETSGDKMQYSVNSIINDNNTIYTLNNKDNTSKYVMTNNAQFGEFSENNGNNNIQKSIEQSTNYIVIPFIAYYKIVDRKADVSISGGINTNILVESNRSLELEKQTYDLGPLETLKRLNYSGIVGINLELPVINKVNFKIEPYLNYNLNSIEKSSSIKIYPYSIGVYSGISYSF